MGNKLTGNGNRYLWGNWVTTERIVSVVLAKKYFSKSGFLRRVYFRPAFSSYDSYYK